MENRLNGIILGSYQYNRIRELKEKLRETDYKAIKYAEGLISYSEYLPTLQERKNWREEINKLEVELKALQSENI